MSGNSTGGCVKNVSHVLCSRIRCSLILSLIFHTPTCQASYLLVLSRISSFDFPEHHTLWPSYGLFALDPHFLHGDPTCNSLETTFESLLFSKEWFPIFLILKLVLLMTPSVSPFFLRALRPCWRNFQTYWSKEV